MNGVDLLYTQQELAELFLGVADGKVSREMLTQWVTEHQE